MDIFILKIEDAEFFEKSLLEKFKKKEISDSQKRREHCFSYFMLDKILDEIYHVKNRNIIFKSNKPRLENDEKFFSISHSKELAVLAFSNFECGIDIEKIIERNFKKIADKMGFSSNNLEEFYCDWTKYEACFKLGVSAVTYKSWRFHDYRITASSINPNENFTIFIQNGNDFSNADI